LNHGFGVDRFRHWLVWARIPLGNATLFKKGLTLSSSSSPDPMKRALRCQIGCETFYDWFETVVLRNTPLAVSSSSLVPNRIEARNPISSLTTTTYFPRSVKRYRLEFTVDLSSALRSKLVVGAYPMNCCHRF